MDRKSKQPVWIDPNEMEWSFEPMWEQCEYGLPPINDVASLDELLAWEKLADRCLNPSEFTGMQPDGSQRQLCRSHFESTVRPQCRVSFS